MASNIIDFFKGFWRSKNNGQDENLNHAPISNQNNNDLALEDSNSKDGSNELLVPKEPNDNDNEATDPSLVCSNLDELSNPDEIYLHDSFEKTTVEQEDKCPQISFSYTTKTKLTSDYIMQNPWVVDLINGKANDEITMVEIEYVASPDICTTCNRNINTATIDILGKEMNFINCEGKETSAHLINAEINQDNMLVFDAYLPDEFSCHLEVMCC